MANTTRTTIVNQGPEGGVLRAVCASDGTNESAAIKIDRSTLTDAAGDEPSSLYIRWVRWNIQGIVTVTLHWANGTPDIAYILSGSGYDEPDSDPDPVSGGGTGDLTFTMTGVAGGSYDISVGFGKNR